MSFARNGSILAALALAGCGATDKLGIDIEVTGEVVVDGDVPDGFDLALYAWGDNGDAFDESWCKGEEDCLGRVDVGKLDTPVTGESIEWDGLKFTMKEVPADLLYVLRVTGDDDGVDCSQDIVGFDEERKVVTKDSAIKLEADGDIRSFELPRPARLSCSVPLAEPTPPEAPEPPEVAIGTDTTTPEGDISVPPTVDPIGTWTEVEVTDADGNPIGGDASGGPATSDLACDGSFPPSLRIRATSADPTAEGTVWLRLQFGSGPEATFHSTPVPIHGGVVDELFALTGGYSVVQLDLGPDLEGQGESHTITFCQPVDPPAQELLAILSWDTDDTDVDLHIDSDHEEVAYYSQHQSWGDLDIDDIDGFGPETFTSAPGETGREYTVWAHYYSDHGNGKTNATVRVVYVDPTTGETCDLTTTKEIPSHNWFRIGKFGPGLDCR